MRPKTEEKLKVFLSEPAAAGNTEPLSIRITLGGKLKQCAALLRKGKTSYFGVGFSKIVKNQVTTGQPSCWTKEAHHLH